MTLFSAKLSAKLLSLVAWEIFRIVGLMTMAQLISSIALSCFVFLFFPLSVTFSSPNVPRQALTRISNSLHPRISHLCPGIKLAHSAALRLMGGGEEKDGEHPWIRTERKKKRNEARSEKAVEKAVAARQRRQGRKGHDIHIGGGGAEERTNKRTIVGEQEKEKKRGRDKKLSAAEKKKKKKKKAREAGIDWNTWQKKSHMIKDRDIQSGFLKPIIGPDGVKYKEKWTNQGFRVKRVDRGLQDMSKAEVIEQAKKEAAALVKATMMNLEETRVHVGSVPTGEISESRKSIKSDSEGWRKALWSRTKAAVDAEEKGLRFTGLYKRGQIPIFTANDTVPCPVTGRPEPLKINMARLTIGQHEDLHRYTREGAVGEADAPKAIAHQAYDETSTHAKTLISAAGSTRRNHAKAGQDKEEDEDMDEDVEEGVVATPRKKVMNASEILTMLKQEKKIALTKSQRWDKHVMGFTKEAVARMYNGTLVTDSAWGVRKVIGGVKDRIRGEVWGGTHEGVRRKRRDFKWFRASAIRGNAKAQMQLGLSYREGQGVAKNLRRAAGWFSRAARQGNAQALYHLAEAYRYGEGVKRKNATALTLLERSARRGYLHAQRDLGVILVEGRLGLRPNASAALKWLNKAGQQNDRHSLTRMGLIYAEGADGVPQDATLAETCLIKAANLIKMAHVEDAEKKSSGKRFLFALAMRFLNGDGVKQDVRKAVEWLARAAIKGHTEAVFRLGMCYLNGVGVAVNEEIAVRQFEKAALSGMVEGGFNFAQALMMGRGVARDMTRARQWFSLGAAKGHALSALNLGVCLAKGLGGEQNLREAVQWYHAAADHALEPSADAQFNLALMYSQGNGVGTNKTLALDYYRKASAQGHEQASYDLAVWLLGGYDGDVAQNGTEAFRVLKGVCDTGHASYPTMFLLGMCYAKGDGADVDDEEAAYWFLKSAQAGGPLDLKWAKGAVKRGGIAAKALIAWVCDAGPEEQRDIKRAIQLYSELGKLGDEEAMFRCGECILQDPKSSVKKAVQWFERAAKAGHVEAMTSLARMFAKGVGGLPLDHSASVYWYARAAEKGDAKAQFRLGVCYQYGKGVDKDPFMCSEYYMAAAEQGYVDSMFALGMCYAKGRGVEKSHELASEWLSKAANQGHAKAAFNLALRLTEGLGIMRNTHVAAYWFNFAAQRRIKGHGAITKKGVWQDAKTLELPIDGQEPAEPGMIMRRRLKKKVPKRVMPLSEYEQIRWNHNPSKKRVKDYLPGELARLEGSKVPRMVYIDDKTSSLYGQSFYTRPRREKADKDMVKLVMRHGLDFKAMRLDHHLNPYGWGKNKLKKKVFRALKRKVNMPRSLMEGHEKLDQPILKKHLAELNAMQDAKRAEAARIRYLLEKDGEENPLGLTDIDRPQQLLEARESMMLLLQAPMGNETKLLLPGMQESEGALVLGQNVTVGTKEEEEEEEEENI